MKRFLLTSGSIVIIVSVLIVFFLFTTTGLRALYKLAPDNLSVVIAGGDLARGVVLEDLQFESEGIRLNIEQLEIEWQSSDLLSRQLTINHFEVNTISLELMGESSDPSAGETDITLPIGVRVNNFSIRNITIITAGSDQPQSIQSITGNLHTEGQRLFIDGLSITADSYALNLEGQVDLLSVPAYRISANWSYRHPDYAELVGQTSLTGDLMLSNINTIISAPEQVEFAIEARNLIADPSWQGTISANRLNTNILTESLAAHEFSLAMSGNGTLTSAVFQGQINTVTNTAISSTPAPISDAAYQLERINLEFAVDASFPTIDELTLSANLNLQESTISAIGPAGNRLHLETSQVQIDYENNNYQLSVDTSFLVNDELDGTLQTTGSGNLDSLTLDTISLLLDQGILTGEISVLRNLDNITLSARANWEDLLLPINTEQFLKLSDGDLNLTGQLDDYTLTLDTSIGVDDKGPYQLSVSATGDQSSIQMDPLSISLGGGLVTGKVSAEWLNNISASLELGGRNINPGIFLDEWPGNLAMNASITAMKAMDEYEVNVENLDVSGQLRGFPLTIQLISIINNEAILISKANVISGTSNAQISGTWGIEKDINWVINSPDLSNLHEQMQGQLEASGQFSGSMEQPHLSGNLHSTGVRTPWLDVDSIDSSFLINQSSPSKLDIELEITGLVRDEKIIDSIILDMVGDLKNHQYDLEMNSSMADIKLEGQGTYTDLSWQGQTQSLSLEINEKSWLSDDSFTLNVTKDKVLLGRACLHEIEIAICSEAEWDKSDGWMAKMQATGVSYKYINAYLPESVRAAGIASINIDASQNNTDPIKANVAILSNSGSITFQIDNNNEQEFILENLSSLLTLENEVLNGQLTIQSGNSELPPLEASISLSPVSLSSIDIAEMNMQGQLNWQINDLSFASNIVTQLADVTGKLEIAMSADGKLAKPTLSGTLRIENAGLMLPEFGIELVDINLTGQPSTGDDFQFTGQAKSGEGVINVSAEIINEDPSQQLIKAVIQGENFELINTPEVRANASSDLVLELSPEKNSLSGTLGIANALVDLNEIKQSASLSADVVMADSPENQKPVSRTEIMLDIRFDENIQIKGQGISGQLNGGLKVFSAENGELLGNGEVSIVNGRYAAYGQDLTIEEGKVIYRNQQLDNPELRITAVRIIGADVRAGLTVTGFLSNPQVTLISTPSLRDEEILSYIVFGRPLAQLTSGEGTNLIGAATALGIKNSGFLSKSLSSTFGLDQLELASDSGGENASLTVGKYITPKIYISYVVGLMESFSTVKIRYNLSRKWSLEAKSSTESMGADVFYSFEK